MKIINVTLASVAALALVACASETPAEDTAADTTAVADEATGAGTIVAVAQGDDAFSTLVTAVTAADLGATLSGAGRSPCSRPPMTPLPSCPPAPSKS